MEHALARCQERLGYAFSNEQLLVEALTHPSTATTPAFHNERLEFLGDAILGAIVCEELFHHFPDAREGELTRVKSVVVSRSTLARVSARMGLDEFVQVGRGMTDGDKLPRRVLGNLYEALLAAIYLDGGLEPARAFVRKTLSDRMQEVASGDYSDDFKSLLQQHTQREHGATPTYRVIAEEGPDHRKRFRVIAMIGSTPYASGTGATKKQAEQQAAGRTYRQLAEEGEVTIGPRPNQSGRDGLDSGAVS